MSNGCWRISVASVTATWFSAPTRAGWPRPPGSSGQIAIWQTQTWPEAARLNTAQGSADRLIFSSSGQRLAALVRGGETENQIVVWEVPAWRLVSQFALADVGWDIALSPDGRWLLVGLGQASSIRRCLRLSY